MSSAESNKDQPSPPQTTTASPGEKLRGSWQLNAEQSDDPKEKLKSASQSDSHGHQGGRGGNGGPGMGRSGGGMGGGIGIGGIGIGTGRRGGRGGEPRSGSSSQTGNLAELLQPAQQLTISPKGPEIDMTDNTYHTRALFTDGRKVEKPGEYAILIPVPAHWEGSNLVADETGPDGEKISRSYAVSDDGKQLTEMRTIGIKKLPNPVVARYVYDKVE